MKFGVQAKNYSKLKAQKSSQQIHLESLHKD